MNAPTRTPNRTSTRTPNRTPARAAARPRPSVAPPAHAEPPVAPTYALGVVRDVAGGVLQVALASGVRPARRAVSCLVEPLAGDRVACLCETPDTSALWVTAVLERPQAADTVHTLSCEGPLTLRASTLSLAAGCLQLDADQAALRCEQADLMGTRLNLMGGTLKAVGSALSTVFDRVLHHSRQHLRTTEGLDKVQANQLICEASQLLELHGEHTLINGEKLVKARGAQIHFG